MELHDRIYELRRKAGLSQDELAQRCLVSRQSVSKWENGSAIPEVEKIMLLAELFDVSVDYLLGRKEEPKKVIMMEVPSKEEFEYMSKWHIFGLPLVHIHLQYCHMGFGYRMGFSKCKARGVVAIGNTAIGLFALGIRSMGLCSIGLLSMGMFSLGVVTLGIFALGMIALGFAAFGLLAIGYYAFGVAVVAWKLGAGVAVFAIKDGIGVAIQAGENAFHTKRINGQECLISSANSLPYEQWLQHTPMPGFLRAMLSYFSSC